MKHGGGRGYISVPDWAWGLVLVVVVVVVRILLGQ